MLKSNIKKIYKKIYIYDIFVGYCELPTLANGQINATQSQIITRYYEVGTNISFTCNSGYTLIGISFSSCQTNGSWNSPPPTCRQGNESKKQ